MAASIKWGVPTYQQGKTSRMLKVRTAKDIDTASIKRRLKTASQ